MELQMLMFYFTIELVFVLEYALLHSNEMTNVYQIKHMYLIYRQIHITIQQKRLYKIEASNKLRMLARVEKQDSCSV